MADDRPTGLLIQSADHLFLSFPTDLSPCISAFLMAKQDNTRTGRPRSPRSAAAQELANLGKIQPQDLELEEAVLGALMLDKNALTEVIEILKPDTFYKEAHQRIFEAILGLFGRSEPVDLLTVVSELRTMGYLELVGGAKEVARLTTRVNSAANVVYHARILLQHAIKRDMISISTDIQTAAYEDTTDVFELLDKMEQALFEISEMNIRKNYSNIRSVMQETFQELEAMRGNTDGLTGVPSGFASLDRVTSGWQRSDLIILAARPGMGKTAFVLSMLRNAAVEFNHGAAIFSLEMSATQLVRRLLSAEAELYSQKLRSGKLSNDEWSRMIRNTSRLSNAPIFIDDTPALSVLELRAKCRRLKAQHNIQIIIIDYLQLMTADTRSSGNREQEIAFISRSLKQLAKELNVPVIALSQLNRSVETRGGDKKPQLSDLRESGSIEQDADMVIFLYRPEYYKITEDESGGSTDQMTEVIIAKHRAGSTDTVKLRFISEFTKFTDWEEGGSFAPVSSFADTYSLPSLATENSTPPPAADVEPASITLGSRMNKPRNDQNANPFSGISTDEVPF